MGKNLKDFDKKFELANNLLPEKAKQEKGWRMNQLILIPALLACLAGPFVGKNRKERMSDFMSQKTEWSGFTPLLLQAKIEKGNPERLDTIHIGQVYGENFDKVGAIDTIQEQKIVEEIVKKIQALVDQNIITYGPFPGFDGLSFDIPTQEIDIVSIQGGASAENYSQKKLNQKNDKENIGLAYARAESLASLINNTVKRDLETHGNVINIEHISISGKVNPFTESELQIFRDIASKYISIQDNDKEGAILSFLYQYHHNQIDNLDQNDKQEIDNILNDKRTVKIVIQANNGNSKTVYNFLTLPRILLFFGLWSMMRMNNINKASKLRNQIFDALNEGKNPQRIEKNIIETNEYYGGNSNNV